MRMHIGSVVKELFQTLPLPSHYDLDAISLGQLKTRTSWLQRTSRLTVLDVHVIDDKLTVNIMQRNRINCLLHDCQYHASAI
ncbi:hypothetical protein MLD38_036662 [Melastoma candidum]|uniref:Uncharacterized protein n=1 Tax=Melastoma candidum TaxID=119954 RepID=A0ACB9LKM0_9MYRT|nr:hypothetical protein MLD38_036662 [Melastoma candidum]